MNQPNHDRRGEDEALLARVQRGDRSALEQLYRRNAEWLTARLQTRCADIDIVDIAVQDTFLAVWKKPSAYRGDGAVAAWLWGIAVRRLIDQLRKSRPIPVAPDSITAGAVTFEETVMNSGAHGELPSALAKLSPDLQAVMLATAIDGLTTKETARLLNIPQGTVKTRLMRARAQLQEILT